MDPSVFTALSTLAGIIITAIIAPYLQRKWRESTSPKEIPPVLETNAEREIEEMLFELEDLNWLHLAVLNLLSETNADRFLILRAENGRDEPRYATVVYEQHEGVPHVIATSAYIRVNIDDDYRRMLKSAELDGVFRMKTEEMSDQLLKRVYQREGVQHSNCYFLDRKAIGENQAILTYCTIATHKPEPFDKVDDDLPQQLFVNQLKKLFTE